MKLKVILLWLLLIAGFVSCSIAFSYEKTAEGAINIPAEFSKPAGL